MRELLRLAGEDARADATLVALGMESLQAIALQYQILEETGVDINIEDLLGDRTVAELAAFLESDLTPETVAALSEAPA